MSNAIAIINQKGGVAKTTTVFNVAACLSAAGQRVLAIDLDPQGSLTSCYGIEPEQVEVNMYHVLCKGVPLDNIKIAVNERLDLAPAIIDLSAAEIELSGKYARENILKRILLKQQEEYDYILIDCPPSLTLLPINALCAAKYVIIPVATDYLSYRGLRLLLNTLNDVQINLNDQLNVMGVIATLYDRRTKHANEILDQLKSQYRLLGVVNKAVSIQDAAMTNVPMNQFDPASKITKEFERITREITGFINERGR